MRTIAYLRVSTEGQAESGHSLAAQREKVEGYAKLYGLDLIEVIEDAASAKSLDRPGLQRALGMLRDGTADALLVSKLDRLTRSVRDLGSLIEGTFNAETGKPALLSVADQIDTRTAGGRLVLNVLMSVSQWERESISERTRDTMRAMKAAGKVVSRPTMGFDAVDGRLVANDSEQAIIARVISLNAAGASYSGIASILNAEQVPTKRGGRWQPTTVRNLVLRQV